MVSNHRAESAQVSLTAKVSGPLSISNAAPMATVSPNATRAFPLAVRATGAGEATLKVVMTVEGKVVDGFERTLTIEAPGRLERRTVADRFENGQGALTIDLERAGGATIRGRLRAYRGATDRAIDGAETLVREPHGCFEQTSSATYPNLLIVRLLSAERSSPTHAALVKRARRFVAEGYQRLIGYEHSEGGFSWFGYSSGDVRITAYGLLEFSDMAAVYPVDQQMLVRTRRWLLSKQSADGSWRQAGSSPATTTAYVSWALAESGYRGPKLSRALSYLSRQRQRLARDVYGLSLWAAAQAALTKKPGAAFSLLKKHIVTNGKESHLSKANARSLFYSVGERAGAEATALAAMAFWRAGDHNTAKRLAAWLLGTGSTHWRHSTQGPVLALRAHEMTTPAQPIAEGTATVLVNGNHAGSIDLASERLESLNLDKWLRAGKNKIEFRASKEALGLLAVSADLSWREPNPNGKPASNGISVTRKTKELSVARGQKTHIHLTVTNPSLAKVVELPMVVATIPPGFRFYENSLGWLERNSNVRKAELVGDELRLYLRDMGQKSSFKLEYAIVGDQISTVRHRAAIAYAYYDRSISGRTGAEMLSVRR